MTNEQKIKVFKKAIINLKKRQQTCLCVALWVACGAKAGLSISIMNDKFPELLKYKPFCEINGGYWWPKDEIEPRIEVLEKAIKELETTNL